MQWERGLQGMLKQLRCKGAPACSGVTKGSSSMVLAAPELPQSCPLPQEGAACITQDCMPPKFCSYCITLMHT